MYHRRSAIENEMLRLAAPLLDPEHAAHAPAYRPVSLPPASLLNMPDAAQHMACYKGLLPLCCSKCGELVVANQMHRCGEVYFEMVNEHAQDNSRTETDQVPSEAAHTSPQTTPSSEVHGQSLEDFIRETTEEREEFERRWEEAGLIARAQSPGGTFETHN